MGGGKGKGYSFVLLQRGEGKREGRTTHESEKGRVSRDGGRKQREFSYGFRSGRGGTSNRLRKVSGGAISPTVEGGGPYFDEKEKSDRFRVQEGPCFRGVGYYIQNGKKGESQTQLRSSKIYYTQRTLSEKGYVLSRKKKHFLTFKP